MNLKEIGGNNQKDVEMREGFQGWACRGALTPLFSKIKVKWDDRVTRVAYYKHLII